MSNIKISRINQENREAFYTLAKEYLPDSDYEVVESREQEYRDTYVVLLDGCEVIGVAFGWPRRIDVPEDMSLSLDGIAVRADYQKQGYGPMLLREVEKSANMYGCESVSVGSAGGYVEKFYIANGFMPQTYKVYMDGGVRVEKVFEDLQDYYQYERQSLEGFVVLEKYIN